MALTAEQIARVCHEANRAYCASIGDLSQMRAALEWLAARTKARVERGVEGTDKP